jgi:predicted ATPase
MIDRVTCNKALSGNIRQDIIERTDGVPLFVEEMTKAVLEAENEGAAQRAVAAIPSPSVAVPASLHASLMARLDRLGSAKEVAQIGAVIGREFPHALIAAVAHKGEPELRSALDRLIDAGLLFRQGAAPHATYLFKHALVQDAAYGTLLREPRRALHARIAETLESGFTDIAENQPEILARHCTEAGLIEKSAGHWGKAGLRSLERSALVEAAEQLTRALDQFATLPPTSSLRREQIKLQVALITPLLHVKGYAAPETREAAERARVLIEQAEATGDPPDDPLLLFSSLYGLWASSVVRFNGDACIDLATRFLTLAKKQKDTAPVMVGHRIMGSSLLLSGDIAEGQAHLNRAIALYNADIHKPLASRFGQDVRVVALIYRAMALWFLGFPDAALADAGQVVSQARVINQAATLMIALCSAGLINLYCGNYAVTKAQADEALALANEKAGPGWTGFGLTNLGCVMTSTGKASEAIELISTGSNLHRSTGDTMWRPSYLPYLAKAYADLCQFNDAWRCSSEAIEVVQKSKERIYEAEALRVAGEIALKSPEHDATKATVYFERALSVARQQQAKSWELRAAMSLARLRRDQGKVSEARELLAPVYGWFTEGFDTRDLKDAKALLEELV